MDDLIRITELNDFIFCPASIYFHNLYGSMDKMIYQNTDQINGTAAHEAVDERHYSSKKDIITGLEVYSEVYGLVGKIDILDNKRHMLRERKKKIKTVYDGYVFQVYAQYFALKEMGYRIEKIELYSMDDHKTYDIKLPENDEKMFAKFNSTIDKMKHFVLEDFAQDNIDKCKRCIYEPACDRSGLEY